MGKLTDFKHRVKDWKEGILPEHRAEARRLRDEITDLQSRIDSIHEQVQPSPQSTIREDLFGHDVIQHSAMPSSLSGEAYSSLNAEAVRLIALRNEKSARLESLSSKRKGRGAQEPESALAGNMGRMERYAAGVERIKGALEPVYAAINTLTVDERTAKTPLRQALASVRNSLSATSEMLSAVTRGAESVTDDASAQAHVLSLMKEWMRTATPQGGGMNDEAATHLIRTLADVLKNNLSK